MTTITTEQTGIFAPGTRSRRSTVPVEDLKNEINRRLALRTITTEERKALAILLEDVLMGTGKYHGFNWLHWTREGGFEAWKAAGEPEGAEKNQFIHGTPDGKDDYRRVYY